VRSETVIILLEIRRLISLLLPRAMSQIRTVREVFKSPLQLKKRSNPLMVSDLQYHCSVFDCKKSVLDVWQSGELNKRVIGTLDSACVD